MINGRKTGSCQFVGLYRRFSLLQPRILWWTTLVRKLSAQTSVQGAASQFSRGWSLSSILWSLWKKCGGDSCVLRAFLVEKLQFQIFTVLHPKSEKCAPMTDLWPPHVPKKIGMVTKLRDSRVKYPQVSDQKNFDGCVLVLPHGQVQILNDERFFSLGGRKASASDF